MLFVASQQPLDNFFHLSFFHRHRFSFRLLRWPDHSFYHSAKKIFYESKNRWTVFFCCLISEREPSVSGVARSTLATQGDSVDTEEDAETDDTGSTSGKAPSPSNPLLQERSNCEELRHVVCHLETKELWDKFNELGTEMIITKTGR